LARRRYLSTEISVDKRINKYINKYGLGAGLLYSWMIPHAEDDRGITSDPDEIKMTVVPGIENISVDDISQYISGMAEFGLVEEDGNKLYFPDESFYKYQSYIPENKRNHNKTPQITEEYRQIPQNAASPSPSPSPSPSKDICAASARTHTFTPPTIDEVKAYCTERHNRVDAENFVDHYEAANWFRGKTKIKNWKACVRTWEKGQQQNKPPGNIPQSNFKQRPIEKIEYDDV